jgi:hypothetical protein
MLRALTAGLTVAALFVGLVTFAVAQGQDVTAIGIDASPVGNTATSLGEIDACTAVSQGDSLQVDLFVQNAEDLLAWEAYLFFDSELLTVTGRDVQFFQAAGEGSSVFDASESVPDDDGRYRVGGADIADPPSPESGSGVLARLSLRALAPGTATLSIAPVQIDIGTIGPFLRDVEGSLIGDEDGDSLFDGPIIEAEVRIDGECPGGGAPPVLETPRASPEDGSGSGSGDGDDSSTALWIGLGIGIGAIVSVGGLGVYLWSRRRAAGGPASGAGPDITS